MKIKTTYRLSGWLPIHDDLPTFQEKQETDLALDFALTRVVQDKNDAWAADRIDPVPPMSASAAGIHRTLGKKQLHRLLKDGGFVRYDPREKIFFIEKCEDKTVIGLQDSIYCLRNRIFIPEFTYAEVELARKIGKDITVSWKVHKCYFNK